MSNGLTTFNDAASLALLRLKAGNELGATTAANAMFRLADPARKTQIWAAEEMLRTAKGGYDSLNFASVDVPAQDVGIHLEMLAWDYNAGEYANMISEWESERDMENHDRYQPYSPEDPRELMLIADFEERLAACPSYHDEEEVVSEPEPQPEPVDEEALYFAAYPDYLKGYAAKWNEAIEADFQQKRVADEGRDFYGNVMRDDDIPF